MKTVRCDRCSKIFTVPVEENVPYLKHYDFGEESGLDLCNECSASLALWIEKYRKEVDEFINKLSEGDD
jgi:hypothetical protein